jgi:hypothetical protein
MRATARRVTGSAPPTQPHGGCDARVCTTDSVQPAGKDALGVEYPPQAPLLP